MEKIYIVKHVPFEGPGYIEKWAEQNCIKLEILNAYDFEFPDIEKNCGVILMGGPMSVNDDYVFLKKEKTMSKTKKKTEKSETFDFDNLTEQILEHSRKNGGIADGENFVKKLRVE